MNTWHRGQKHPLWPVFMSTSKETQKWGIVAHNDMCISFLALNTQLTSLIFPCLTPPPVLTSVSLSGDCLPARRVAEGVGEVIQSRILPSHPPTWYSYHGVTPHPPEAACLNTGSLKETFSCHFNSHFPLLTSLLPFLHVLSTLSSSLFYLFRAHSLLCWLSSSLIPVSPYRKSFFFLSGSWDSVCISNHVRASAGSCNDCWDGHRAALRRAADLVEVTGSLSQQHAAAAWDLRPCVTVCVFVLYAWERSLYTSSPAYSYSYPISQSWGNSAINKILHIEVRYRLQLVFTSNLRMEKKIWSQWFWPWYDSWCQMSWFEYSCLWHCWHWGFHAQQAREV